jgi:cell division protein FtsQ
MSGDDLQRKELQTKERQKKGLQDRKQPDKDELAQWRSPSFLWGSAFLITVIVGLSILGDSTMNWLRDAQKVPLKNVLVNGNLNRVTVEEIESTVNRGKAVSLFSINVDKLHADIENLPWVYQASIRKSWPDTLMVYVVEQEVVAWWNQDLLLNQYGGIFDAAFAETDPVSQQVPLLFGPGGSELTVLQGLRAMQGLLEMSELQISELSLSERYAWELKLSNGVQLRLGRTEFMDRLQRFIDIYPLLLKNEKTVEYVDLRYDTGLAVGWKSTSTDV